LEKEGQRIAKELNQSPPSSSWYLRFMKRNGLSLQKPKRQHKVPLDEVHRLANSFYMFNRRVSSWSLKRGPMGGFIDEDICNMDESPLALFGDQSKRSVNDVGSSNEINGCISNKVIYHLFFDLYLIFYYLTCPGICFYHFRDFVRCYLLFLLKINEWHQLFYSKVKAELVLMNDNNIQKEFMLFLHQKQ